MPYYSDLIATKYGSFVKDQRSNGQWPQKLADQRQVATFYSAFMSALEMLEGLSTINGIAGKALSNNKAVTTALQAIIDVFRKLDAVITQPSKQKQRQLLENFRQTVAAPMKAELFPNYPTINLKHIRDHLSPPAVSSSLSAVAETSPKSSSSPSLTSEEGETTTPKRRSRKVKKHSASPSLVTTPKPGNSDSYTPTPPPLSPRIDNGIPVAPPLPVATPDNPGKVSKPNPASKSKSNLNVNNESAAHEAAKKAMEREKRLKNTKLIDPLAKRPKPQDDSHTAIAAAAAAAAKKRQSKPVQTPPKSTFQGGDVGKFLSDGLRDKFKNAHQLSPTSKPKKPVTLSSSSRNNDKDPMVVKLHPAPTSQTVPPTKPSSSSSSSFSSSSSKNSTTGAVSRFNPLFKKPEPGQGEPINKKRKAEEGHYKVDKRAKENGQKDGAVRTFRN